MPQPAITLTAASLTLTLDPDMQWVDEFDWSTVEQRIERSISGALLIDTAIKPSGRPITLQSPADNAAWVPRATLTQLQQWESQPELPLSLSLRGTIYPVVFDRRQGSAFSATPVMFQADPQPGDPGDYYLLTLRLIEV